MSNTPESTIFGKMTSRPAGKRQIKPTAVLFATLAETHSSDEEDEDFEMKTDETDGKTASGSDESTSESDSDEEESEMSEKEKSPSIEREDQIFCAVCVNQKESDDFLQCERCKIHVHGSCYGASVSNPEKWYCEPCEQGLAEPPYCELCPSRLGAFKSSVLPGRWCHVVCALFTHGVRFVKPETRSGIAWDRLENSQFGKRTCLGCTDKIEARLGISSRCESGLCKEILHTTCAQKMGLLVDEGEENSAFSRYFFCKKHSNCDNLRAFQRKFQTFEKLEHRRILVARRVPVLEVSDRKHVDYSQKFDADRQKQSRLLNTSSEFYDRFESKAIDSGMTRESFRDPFFNIRMSNTSSFPIGFSKEYIDFMHLRDTQIIPEEEEKLRKSREMLEETKQKHEKQKFSKHLTEKYAENERKLTAKLESLQNLREILASFGEKNHEDFSRIIPERLTFCGSIVRKKAPTTKCVVCGGSEDVHKQTQCDQCHQSFHIGCLSPPLTRLPKRNKVGWICHECNESSDSEMEIVDLSETRSSRSRRPPARLSAFVNH